MNREAVLDAVADILSRHGVELVDIHAVQADAERTIERYAGKPPRDLFYALLGLIAEYVEPTREDVEKLRRVILGE